jgi:hypothetical protein
LAVAKIAKAKIRPKGRALRIDGNLLESRSPTVPAIRSPEAALSCV